MTRDIQKVQDDIIEIKRLIKQKLIDDPDILEALNKDAKTLVNLLVEKVVVYEEKIEISYKYYDNKNPDETVTEVHRDFLFIDKMIQITQRNFTVSYQL